MSTRRENFCFLSDFAIIGHMYKKLFLIVCSVFCLLFVFCTNVFAQPLDETDPGETFVRAKVLGILKQGIVSFGSMKTYDERMNVALLEGREKGKIVAVERSGDPSLIANKIYLNETIVIDSKPDPSGKMTYTVYEPYRLNILYLILAGFLLFIVLIAGKKGFGALAGLTISILVISFWIIPQILHGQDPLTTCIIGASAMLLITSYIAHGISLKTTIAVIGTALSLVFAGYLAIFFVQILHIFGTGNEDVYNLQVGTMHPINPQGLFLGSILIGTLGALNDITTTQAITMFTLVKENPKQKFPELFKKGMIIGKEHIASLINTLVLAYAGSSLAVFVFFELNPAQLPWWVILNNESTMEELIKSIIGSSGLILAVPITTSLATWVALQGTNVKTFTITILEKFNIVIE